MPDKPNFVVYHFGITAAIVAFFGTATFAQVADEVEADDSEAIEEIIVTAPKPGDRRRADREYEDPVRARLLKDLYKMREEEEEFEWRTAAAAEKPSRISWGYDPQDEYRMRNELDLLELPSERTRPATLFRVGF